MKLNTIIYMILFVLMNVLQVHSHGNKKHEEKGDSIGYLNHHKDSSTINKNTDIPLQLKEPEIINSEFLTYHPLIVHFPIVLLLLLPFLQIFSFFFLRKGLGYIIIIIALAGLITSIISSTLIHPHTINLPTNIAEILENHEFYAYLSSWICGIALLLKFISQFWLKNNFILELIVCALFVSTAISIAIAGHHGAQLTHIYGIGPKGNYIEINHHN